MAHLSPAAPPSSHNVLFMGPLLTIKQPVSRLRPRLLLAARSHAAVQAAA